MKRLVFIILLWNINKQESFQTNQIKSNHLLERLWENIHFIIDQGKMSMY